MTDKLIKTLCKHIAQYLNKRVNIRSVINLLMVLNSFLDIYQRLCTQSSVGTNSSSVLPLDGRDLATQP